MYNRPWTEREDRVLLANLERPRHSWGALAYELGRSVAAVKMRAAKLRERRQLATARLSLHPRERELCDLDITKWPASSTR